MCLVECSPVRDELLFVSFTLILDCPCLDLGPVLRMSLITEMI